MATDSGAIEAQIPQGNDWWSSRKVWVFGVLGALGCLAGWLVGEEFLALAMPTPKEGTAQVALVSKPELPEAPRLELAKPAPPPLPSLRVDEAVKPPPPGVPVLQAGKPPPPPPEFEKRLAEAGAKTGDVQISLIWNNYNDLDLHCLAPDGEHIWFNARRSASGGELDVDRNAGGRETNRPVENIYWPPGKAPYGKYQVYVHYWANHGDPDPTPFEVNILANEERRSFKGVARNEGRRPRAIGELGGKPIFAENSRDWIQQTGIFVHEFEVSPRFAISVSPQLIIYPGTSNQLRVRVERGGRTGAVRCQVEGDLSGLEGGSLGIPAGQDEGVLEIRAASNVAAGRRTLTVRAQLGETSARANFEIIIEIPKNLALAASPYLEVFRGQANELPLRLACSGIKGPISVGLEGDLSGITASHLVLDPKQETANLKIGVTPEARAGERKLAVVAQAEGLLARAEFQLYIKDPTRLVRIAVPEKMQIAQGGENTLPVRVGRRGFTGSVRLRLEGDTEGLAPTNLEVPAEKDEGEFKLSATKEAQPGQRRLRIIAEGPGGLRDEQGITLEVVAASAAAAEWSWWTVVVVGLWTSLLAVGLSVLLVAGQNWYLGRSLLQAQEIGVLAAGSLAAGLVSGGLGQILYGVLFTAGIVPKIGFLLGWSLLGGLLGRVLAGFIPNLNAWRASAAGAVGGFVGSVAFLAVSLAGDTAGRFVGAAILGFAIGLMVALIELAYRRYWLELRWGPRKSCIVNLGSQPVVIGGDSKRATVYVPGAPAKALQFWEKDGQVYCLDVLKEETTPVSPGYRRRLRDCEIIVHCSSASA
ncbi:MAG: DUF2135 domain-containing protein [Gemmatales bacterium]|nr:DUF2135 domain-containing protein [Gemmatales bacterium]